MIVRTRPASVWLLACFTLVAATGSHAAMATDLSGCWRGSWTSCSTGHHGPLEASFARCDETHYAVEFRGRFFRFIPFRYSVTLEVVEDRGDEVVLAGSSFLGRLFGTFTYRAEADGCAFHATYHSKKDSGTFDLRRNL